MSIVTRAAVIEGNYRYYLSVRWSSRTPLGIIMVNPSTADGLKDDATSMACRQAASRHGFGGVAIANLFALRSRDPRAIPGHHDPIGPENDVWIKKLVSDPAPDFRCSIGALLLAWGQNGRFLNRDKQVLEIVRANYAKPLYVLAETKNGTPRHPLYLPHSLRLKVWSQDHGVDRHKLRPGTECPPGT